MKKTLLKMLMPSAESLSKWAAEKAQKAVNGSEKAELLAKWTGYAGKAGEVQAAVAKWMEDGKVDDAERDQLAAALVPLFRRLEELL